MTQRPRKGINGHRMNTTGEEVAYIARLIVKTLAVVLNRLKLLVDDP